jgi:hypothetical protein
MRTEVKEKIKLSNISDTKIPHGRWLTIRLEMII